MMDLGFPAGAPGIIIQLVVGACWVGGAVWRLRYSPRVPTREDKYLFGLLLVAGVVFMVWALWRAVD
ncbi:MAG: hypothetical protein ACR2PK_17190 [Acidimicrobiales bacterium]